MSKFQPPMLNDDVCRARTDKQTHKHTYTHIHKHTYRVKTEETFFTAKFFIVYFSFSISLKVKKDGFQYTQYMSLMVMIWKCVSLKCSLTLHN